MILLMLLCYINSIITINITVSLIVSLLHYYITFDFIKSNVVMCRSNVGDKGMLFTGLQRNINKFSVYIHCCVFIL